jgi:hypothetical protein
MAAADAAHLDPQQAAVDHFCRRRRNLRSATARLTLKGLTDKVGGRQLHMSSVNVTFCKRRSWRCSDNNRSYGLITIADAFETCQLGHRTDAATNRGVDAARARLTSLSSTGSGSVALGSDASMANLISSLPLA